MLFFLLIRRPPISTRTDTLLPYTTLVRSGFTPQELGGVQNIFTKTTGKTIGLSTGFRGSFAQDWDYEAALSYSRYKAKVAWPRIIADVANDFFMGPQLGTDGDGYPIYGEIGRAHV